MGNAPTGYLHIAIVSATAILGYPPVPHGMQRVLEFPEGVALEIEAYHDVLEPIRKGNAGR
jgi:hypothetical protein